MTGMPPLLSLANAHDTIIGLKGVVCKKQYQWLVLAWTQKSLMSFFFTISDEANAANEAVAEGDICQLCNGLKETTNDGSRFGFCKQRSLGQQRPRWPQPPL